MMFSLDVTHRQGAFTLDCRFESAGRLTALFGPSGSGKTTLVNIVAGLIHPDRGRVAVDERVLVDTARRLALPVHRRRIGYVFQDARLFPHMSVTQNLRYGERHIPPAERYARFDHVVELLGIGHLLARRPEALSGGEKQRVAIGRALLASPRLLLMDEPLAALDEARKAEILPYVERLRDEAAVPILYVSHALAEVSRLATDMVVLADGAVRAAGPTDAIMQRLDLLPEDEQGEGGAVLDGVVTSHDDVFDLTVIDTEAGTLRLPRLDTEPGKHVRIRIRARDVMVATERPRGLSALNVIEGTIRALEPRAGAAVDAFIDCGGQTLVARITRQSERLLELSPGRPVFAVVKSVSFDRGGLATFRTG
ncbi:MAG: molybdenum ABC transporter ATP-binding protein [Nitratireductor sp.]